MKPLLTALTLTALALWYVRRKERELVERVTRGYRW